MDGFTLVSALLIISLVGFFAGLVLTIVYELFFKQF